MNRALLFSAAMHGIAFVMVLTVPTPRGPRWIPPDSVAVDLVASVRPAAKPAPQVLPTPAVQPEPEIVTPKEAPKEPPQDTPTVKPPTKKPAKSTARTLKPNAPKRPPDGPSLEERIRQRLAKVPSEEASEDASPAPVPAAPAGASSADVQAVDFPYAWYLNMLRTRITDAWDPPGESLLTGRSKQVTIAFRVARDGTVDNVTISGTSGTPGLDASARRAVERAQPFPPLPDAYEGATLDVAVRFTVGGNS